jgi:hypothetical protein
MRRVSSGIPRGGFMIGCWPSMVWSGCRTRRCGTTCAAVDRREIAAAAGRARPAAFILQDHAPGAEAEVDFGEVWVELAGERTKCFLFAFRLSFSGKAVHRVFLAPRRSSIALVKDCR